MNAISINAAPFTFGARMEAEAVPKTQFRSCCPIGKASFTCAGAQNRETEILLAISVVRSASKGGGIFICSAPRCPSHERF
jgi:hypothetical protein